MALESLRSIMGKATAPFIKRLKWINPNFLTIFSLFISIGAGVFIALGDSRYLLLGALLVFLAGICDYLDGAVARLRKSESKFGDFLDHTIDRFSDVAVFVGVALSGLVNERIGFVNVILILLVSYLGTQAQALTGKRNYGGFIGRADRIVILFACLIFQAFFMALPIVEWSIYFFIVAGAVTVVQRFVKLWRDLASPK